MNYRHRVLCGALLAAPSIGFAAPTTGFAELSSPANVFGFETADWSWDLITGFARSEFTAESWGTFPVGAAVTTSEFRTRGDRFLMEPEFLSVNAPSLDFLQADLRAGGIQNAAGDPGFIFVMPEFVDSGPGDSSASFTLRYSIGSAEISGATFTLLGVETAGNGSVQVTGTVEERSGLGRTFNFALGQDATDEQLVETIDVVGGYDVTLQVTVEAENPGDFARFSSLVNTTSVPEPSTVAALFGALSLLVVAGFRWKKATRRPRG